MTALSPCALNTWAEDIGITATLARDRGDIVAGLGIGGPIGDATWNAELMPTFLANGDVRMSALANISTGFMIGARNATAFVEYFHNGFGVGGSGTPLDQLPDDLTDRMTRGQLFTHIARLCRRRHDGRGDATADAVADRHRQSQRFEREPHRAGELVRWRQHQHHLRRRRAARRPPAPNSAAVP